MIRAVLDTNIIISAQIDGESVSALILGLIFEKKIKLLITSIILKEYEDVLKKTKFGLSSRRMNRLLSKIKRSATLIKVKSKITKIKDDADNRFLECAFDGEADFILTGNKKHFPFKTFRGIKIVNPKEFIKIAGPDIVNEVIFS